MTFDSTDPTKAELPSVGEPGSVDTPSPRKHAELNQVLAATDPKGVLYAFGARPSLGKRAVVEHLLRTFASGDGSA